MSKQVVINSTSKTSTIKERARQLYKNCHSLARKQLIDKFCEELLIDENSARTHISWCAKEMNHLFNKPYLTRNIDTSKLKKERAFNLFKTNPDLSRKEIIKLFQSNLNMSENSAATHCSLSANRFKKENQTNSISHKAIG